MFVGERIIASSLMDGEQDASALPEYWGRWFRVIEGTNVKQTNPHIYYQIGVALNDIRGLKKGMSILEASHVLFIPQRWVARFLEETEDIGFIHTREAATNLNWLIEKFLSATYRKEYLDDDDAKWEALKRPMNEFEIGGLIQGLTNFEREFAGECRDIDVFVITPPGLRSARLLMECAEKEFPEKLRNVLPAQAVYDFRQAGRCLVFDLPTACAFHVCRATEALMLRYYEVLAGAPWSFPRRDWKNYNDQLAAKGAPKAITNRLDEIRAEDRNAYIHPDVNVELEDAPMIFTLCTGVMHSMAKEITKINPSAP